MSVIIKVVSGPYTGRKIPVQAGQTAQFGRTEWADFSFPRDAEMSDIHFALDCRPDGYRLRDLNSARGTMLNGLRVTEAAFGSGDEIVAGQTTFAVHVVGETGSTDTDSMLGATSGPAGDDSASGTMTSNVDGGEAAAPRTAAELCAELELEDDSRKLLRPEDSPQGFIDLLVKNELFADAIRVAAYWLPKRNAVWWAYLCVNGILGESMTEKDTAVLEAALSWVKTPDEENRRATMAAAEETDYDRAPSWVALSAFWSGGSLAPVGLPDVEPDSRLTSQGITAALMLTAPHDGPAATNDNYRHFIDTGKQVADGTIELPKA